jgi:hypothetical protein
MPPGAIDEIFAATGNNAWQALRKGWGGVAAYEEQEGCEKQDAASTHNRTP